MPRCRVGGDTSLVQAGVGISNDALKLRRDYGLRCAGLLDLSQLAARALADGARPWCLAELCERVLRRRLRKCAELRTGSNWAAAQLTAEQLECAALLSPRDASSLQPCAFRLQPCASRLQPCVCLTRQVRRPRRVGR